MNERIKELAEQAGIHPSNFEPDADIKGALEKFAELLVRECVKVSATKAGTFDKDSFVAQRIKGHFGVE